MLHRRVLLLIWAFVATLPVVYVATHVVAASRNIVFWDEFDTALDLILRIDMGADWREILRRLFALNNEHRTVTSRLIFAASYWLTGTLNFHVIGAIGNLFLVGACAILVMSVSGWERRIRMGVVLAFLMFQLEHFENFIWSGASIDHFQVVMLGVAAMAALVASGSFPNPERQQTHRSGEHQQADRSRERQRVDSMMRPSSNPLAGARRHAIPPLFLLAILFAALATFTLAQGNMVWPVGAGLLLYQRRWYQLAGWCACGAIVIAAFLQGFEFNPGHNITAITVKSVGHVARYWLALLGAPLTLGDAAFAPVPGFALLAGLGILTARGAVAREPVAMFSAFFAIGALAMIALGRAELAGGQINSRYMVLGALAWAMLLFVLLELGATPEKPFRLLAWLVPALAIFNVSAGLKFAPFIDSFTEVRDRAATSFRQFGEDGRGITRLHPQDRHADVLLKMAEERGVYRLPRFSHRTKFPRATENPAIIAHLDEMRVNDRAVTLGGWAMIPGRPARRGQAYVVLRSEKSQLTFSCVTLQRSDVAAAYGEPEWRFSGFRAVVGRSRLPAEDFDIGVLIADGGRAEFIMTPNRLLLSSPPDARAVRLNETP